MMHKTTRSYILVALISSICTYFFFLEVPSVDVWKLQDWQNNLKDRWRSGGSHGARMDLYGAQCGTGDTTTGAGTSSQSLQQDRTIPFSSCDPMDDPEDPLVKEYGRDNLALMNLYQGTGERTRGFLKKLRDGKAVTVAVVGGSVSWGHGIQFSPPRSTYGERIFDWISDLFPNKEHRYVNGAQPGSHVIYYSYCFAEHIPKDVDLVLAEFDINAERDDSSYRGFENLFRTLLSLPSQPAVIYLSIYTLEFYELAFGNGVSISPAVFYDVPVVSLRNVGIPQISKNPEDIDRVFYHEADPHPAYRLDKKHINEWGHKLLADGTIGYLRKQLCELDRRQKDPGMWIPEHSPHWPGQDIVGVVPRFRSTDAWSPTNQVPTPNPQCYSVLSSKNPLQPTKNKGFELVELNDKKSWMTNDADSEISFRFETVEGHLGFHIWGTNDKTYGAAHCWIDGDRYNDKGTIRVVEAYHAHYSYSIVEWTGELWTSLPAGEHTVTCRTGRPDWGGLKFRIIGLSTR